MDVKHQYLNHFCFVKYNLYLTTPFSNYPKILPGSPSPFSGGGIVNATIFIKLLRTAYNKRKLISIKTLNPATITATTTTIKSSFFFTFEKNFFFFCKKIEYRTRQLTQSDFVFKN